MNLHSNNSKRQRFVATLLLALLLNLSGHVFLHLGDAMTAGDEAHISAHHEAKNTAAPQHACAVCQDHQHLSLASQPIASFTQEARLSLPARQMDVLPTFQPAHFKPSRAPPRG